MKNKFTVSVMVSTYNRPDALNLCILSILNQTVLPDEIVVGDDGSKEETRILIENFKKQSSIPIVHVWHEDKGFRLAMIRNKAIIKCKSEYIIQIDGDLILHENFVKDHVYFAKKGYFIKGGRVNLTKKVTEKFCKNKKLPSISFFSKGIKRRINSIHNLILAAYLAPIYKKNKILGLGCNMSFWKEDFIQINGYDEFYEGWGGEDYDFAFRLLNSGIQRLYLKFSGIAYHLWHNDLYMQNKNKNINYYNTVLKSNKVKCENGADKY